MRKEEQKWPDVVAARDERMARGVAKEGEEWMASAIEYCISVFNWRRQRGNASAGFLVEDLRGWCWARGLSKPKDARVWGSVIRRLESMGHVYRVDDVRPAISSSGGLKSVWRQR